MKKKMTPAQKILRALREEVVNGVYPPGGRLPVRADLEKRFHTTPVTIQKVFDLLVGEGFVVAKGRQGTFVAEKPPHLWHYGLVFPYRNRPDRPWSNFWTALAAEAEQMSRASGYVLTFSYGNETHQDWEAYWKLEEDVLAHRVAGLIFVSPPLYLRGSPVLETPGIPRVGVMGEPVPPNVKAVTTGPDFLDRAIKYLFAQGRRRIAFATVSQMQSYVVASLSKYGLNVPPYWVQSASLDSPSAIGSAIHLLMVSNPAQRPDGLIVTDDNLVPAATAGLVNAGVRVPEDVKVVGHCNFPYPTPSAVPAMRMGYDIRAVLRACIQQLDSQRRGETSPDVISIPLVDESELAAAR